MRLIPALCIAWLPLTALAAGTFTLESAQVKPGAKIADADASGALVGFMLSASKLGKASFTATYGRK
jgi:hypothetical protein